MDIPAVINMNRYLRIAGVQFAVVLSSSCKKDGVQDITVPAPASRIRFFNFGLGAPGVNFYANDTKMTGVSSTSGVESTSGTSYGSVATGGFYTALQYGVLFPLNGMNYLDGADRDHALKPLQAAS